LSLRDRVTADTDLAVVFGTTGVILRSRSDLTIAEQSYDRFSSLAAAAIPLRASWGAGLATHPGSFAVGLASLRAVSLERR
jgi:hypothetical protein